MMMAKRKRGRKRENIGSVIHAQKLVNFKRFDCTARDEISLALAQKKTTTKTIINALVRRTLSTVHMMFAPFFTSFTSLSHFLCVCLCR